MKHILTLLVLVSISTVTFAKGEKLKNAASLAGSTIVTVPVTYGTVIAGAAADKALASTVMTEAGVAGGLAVTGVALAASTGYLIGKVIVKADKFYLKGAIVSKTGEFMGPVFRRIYNMSHEDDLPEVIETKDGSFKVVHRE